MPFRRRCPRFDGRRYLSALLLIFPLAVIGCRDPKVAAYRVPKEKAAPGDARAGHAHDMGAEAAPPAAATAGGGAEGAGGMSPGNAHGLQTAAGNALAWTVPAQWQSKPAGMVRKATYIIAADTGAAAELAVTAFPGDVGGEAANVNRWRGQLGLGAVDDTAAVAAIERIVANGLEIGVVDLADDRPEAATRMLGGMVPYDGATWFFKLVGPGATVAKEKPAFIEFLKTIKPAPAATP